MSSVYTESPGAVPEFNSGCVHIKNAYTLNGRSYDINFRTTDATVQKLRRLDAGRVVQELNSQMKAYLAAANALGAPEKTSFDLMPQNKVYAVQQGQRNDISDIRDPATQRTISTIADSFHQFVNIAPAQALSPTAQPAPIPVNEPEVKPVVGALDHLLLPSGVTSALNLLTFGPVPNLGQVTGSGALLSGLIKFGQNGTEAYSQLKNGEVSNGITSMFKTVGAGSEFVMGLGALGVGKENLGPVACSVAAGAHLLTHVKDLYEFAVHGKPLPKNFGWHVLFNIATFVAPIIILTATFSNPVTALAFTIGAAIVALGSFINANRDVLEDMFAKKQWWEMLLFLAPFIVSIVIGGLGIPHAVWIGLGVSAGAGILKTIGHKVVQKPIPSEAEPQLPPAASA